MTPNDIDRYEEICDYQEWKRVTRFDETNEQIKQKENTTMKKHFLVAPRTHVHRYTAFWPFYLTLYNSFNEAAVAAKESSEHFGGEYVIYEAMSTVKTVQNTTCTTRLYLTEKGAH